MFENEGNEEQINSDVSQAEPSSETPIQAAPVGETKQPDEANVPFHQHPRWIERDNELKSERAARVQMENQLRQLQARLDQPAPTAQAQKEQDALLARLKGIDPEFGERFEKLDQTRSELEELRQWRQQVESQNLRQQAVSTVNTLHEQNKVAPEDRNLYEQILKAKVSEMPHARLEDLPNIYKEVHEMFSKRYEALRRSERESYVKGKTSDTKAPASQAKGQAVPNSKGEEFSKDPETARQQAVQQIVRQMKADREV